MTSRDFCYWLQGYIEICEEGLAERCSQQLTGIDINPKQVLSIKKHLAMVFKHEIDPSYGGKPEQDALNHIHNPVPGKPDTLIRC